MQSKSHDLREWQLHLWHCVRVMSDQKHIYETPNTDVTVLFNTAGPKLSHSNTDLCTIIYIPASVQSMNTQSVYVYRYSHNQRRTLEGSWVITTHQTHDSKAWLRKHIQWAVSGYRSSYYDAEPFHFGKTECKKRPGGLLPSAHCMRIHRPVLGWGTCLKQWQVTCCMHILHVPAADHLNRPNPQNRFLATTRNKGLAQKRKMCTSDATWYSNYNIPVDAELAT